MAECCSEFIQVSSVKIGVISKKTIWLRFSACQTWTNEGKTENLQN